MQFSQQTISRLSSFKSLGDEVILEPKNRFCIFGEGKDALHRGMVVEGRIKESVQSVQLFRLEKSSDGKNTLVSHKARYNPEKKLGFFNALFDDAKVVADFVFPSDALKRLLSYARKNHCTHIRLFRENELLLKARAFDARKYFDELLVEAKRVGVFHEEDLGKDAGKGFVFYLKVATLRLLPKDDFHVTIFSNELVEFQSLKTDLTFHIRDQRLGASFESDLTERLSRGNVLLLDDRRVQSGRYKKKKRKTPDPSS